MWSMVSCVCCTGGLDQELNHGGRGLALDPAPSSSSRKCSRSAAVCLQRPYVNKAVRDSQSYTSRTSRSTPRVLTQRSSSAASSPNTTVFCSWWRRWRWQDGGAVVHGRRELQGSDNGRLELLQRLWLRSVPKHCTRFAVDVVSAVGVRADRHHPRADACSMFQNRRQARAVRWGQPGRACRARIGS